MGHPSSPSSAPSSPRVPLTRRGFLATALGAAAAAGTPGALLAGCQSLHALRERYVGASGTRDEDFMAMAVEIARSDPLTPFGAVIVRRTDRRVVAIGRNRSLESPVLHAEIVAIQSLMKQLGGLGGVGSGAGLLRDHALYTTAESCAMCMGAIIWTGFEEMVYGASIPHLSHSLWPQIGTRAADIAATAPQPTVARGGVLEHECKKLYPEV